MIARCAATEITCESANELEACSTVAMPAAQAIGVSSSSRPLVSTSSMIHLVLPGSTSPAKRLTSMSANPIPSEARCCHISFFVSAIAAL